MAQHFCHWCACDTQRKNNIGYHLHAIGAAVLDSDFFSIAPCAVSCTEWVPCLNSVLRWRYLSDAALDSIRRDEGQQRRRFGFPRVLTPAGAKGTTPLAKRPATFQSASGSVGSRVAQASQSAARLTNMAVAMEGRAGRSSGGLARPVFQPWMTMPPSSTT